MVLVKKGGRVDYVCDGCGEIIEKGTPHNRAGNSPNFKRYHEACEAKPKAEPIVEPVVTEEPVVEPVAEVTKPKAGKTGKPKTGKK